MSHRQPMTSECRLSTHPRLPLLHAAVDVANQPTFAIAAMLVSDSLLDGTHASQSMRRHIGLQARNSRIVQRWPESRSPASPSLRRWSCVAGGMSNQPCRGIRDDNHALSFVNTGGSTTAQSSCSGISITPTFVSFMYAAVGTLMIAAPCLNRTGWSVVGLFRFPQGRFSIRPVA